MRMRRSVSVVLLLIVAFVLTGCDVDGVRGSGNVVTESRDVSGFDEIVLLGSGDVIVTVSGTESLVIEAEDNIMPLLTSDVRGGSLELGASSSVSPTRGITYTVNVATLVGLRINGSGDVTASGIDTDSFEATINGSGDIEPVGTAGDLTVDINGSGSFRGADLTASTGSVDVSGSGSVVVSVSGVLDVSIGGSGNVEYIGDPQLTQEIRGSGDISQG